MLGNCKPNFTCAVVPPDIYILAAETEDAIDGALLVIVRKQAPSKNTRKNSGKTKTANKQFQNNSDSYLGGHVTARELRHCSA